MGLKSILTRKSALILFCHLRKSYTVAQSVPQPCSLPTGSPSEPQSAAAPASWIYSPVRNNCTHFLSVNCSLLGYAGRWDWT